MKQIRNERITSQAENGIFSFAFDNRQSATSQAEKNGMSLTIAGKSVVVV